MVGVNRKAFIRSVESVLAIMLFLSFYNLATQNLTPSLPRPDPTIGSRELLNSLEQTYTLQDYVDEYSLKELSTSIKQLLPPNQGFKIELYYYEPIHLENTDNYAVNTNLSFIRVFPEMANINNIKVFNEGGELVETRVVNNYYKKKISVQADEELKNVTITLNKVNLVTGEDERINTTSIRAYQDQRRISLNLDSISYNHDYYDANATITLLIPYAAKNSIINLNLFYAANESEIINYPVLTTGNTKSYTSQTAQKAKTSRVIMSAELEPNSETTYTLYYELNTNNQRVYDELAEDNNKVVIKTRDEYYESTNPLTSYQTSSTSSVKKNIITDQLNCLINMKVWNYE